MKVLVLANFDVGLYQFRKELLMKLVEMEYEVVLSLPDGELIENLKELGCRFCPTEFSRRGMNPVKDISLLRTYCRLLRREKPDIVLSYTIKPNVYGGIACSLCKVPYVANITGLGTAVENGGFLQFITVMLYKTALKKAQTVFFQNRANERFFTKKKIAVGTHRMLPGSGVNLEQYQPVPYREDDSVAFVFVGRLMKEKGIDQYLEAAEIIRRKYPQTRFHICGLTEQDYAERIRQLQEADVVIYHGQVKEIREIYAAINCTVHPTYYPEGMSNVLLESAATGRPIITTDRPGCREIIDDGKNGYLVREKDTADLVDKIEKFLSLTTEQRRDMGLAGRAKVEKEFDRRIVIEKYLEEIKRAERSVHIDKKDGEHDD